MAYVHNITNFLVTKVFEGGEGVTKGRLSHHHSFLQPRCFFSVILNDKCDY